MKLRLDDDFLKALRPAWIPAAILVATALLAWLAPLPPSLSGLRTAGPYALLLTALGMAWRFNRGRAFVIVASLLGAFAAYNAFPTQAVDRASVVLVSLNVLAAMILPDRGVRWRAAYGWLALLGLEAVLLAWMPNVVVPALIGRVLFAAAFAATMWRAWPDLTALQVGNAGALAAFYIAAEWVGTGVYSAFMSAAGAILVISLLEESHRL
ncbi:MAG TPA: hypothetical protein VFB93_15795, partial [Burkholderiales bacterium]|nr:hypothetical protein [Burkholderiales bacterium]